MLCFAVRWVDPNIFKDHNASIFRIYHLPGSNSFQGQDIYIHIYLILVLFHPYFLFIIFTYILLLLLKYFHEPPHTSWHLCRQYTVPGFTPLEMQHCHSHKTAELNYTHLQVSTPEEEDLNSWNSEAIKLNYWYLICFCCWEFRAFKLHYKGICFFYT